MDTFVAQTTLLGPIEAEALAEAMQVMKFPPDGVGILDLEDDSNLWEVAAYFSSHPNEVELLLLAAAFGSRPFVISKLPENDWVDKVRRELQPVEVGQFFVYGCHDKDKLPPERKGLLIEASMAFGTGHHGTTVGCLKSLENLSSSEFEAFNVVDIGCGTAILSLAAATLWPADVLAVDIDRVAIEVSKTNILKNGFEDRVLCIESDGLNHELVEKTAPFDLAIANILINPLLSIAPSLSEYLAKEGYVILSGILCKQVQEILECYQALGMKLCDRLDIGGWSTLTLQR